MTHEPSSPGTHAACRSRTVRSAPPTSAPFWPRPSASGRDPLAAFAGCCAPPKQPRRRAAGWRLSKPAAATASGFMWSGTATTCCGRSRARRRRRPRSTPSTSCQSSSARTKVPARCGMRSTAGRADRPPLRSSPLHRADHQPRRLARDDDGYGFRVGVIGDRHGPPARCPMVACPARTSWCS